LSGNRHEFVDLAMPMSRSVVINNARNLSMLGPCAAARYASWIGRQIGRVVVGACALSTSLLCYGDRVSAGRIGLAANSAPV